MFKTIKEKQSEVFEGLKKDTGWKNRFEAPKIEKVIINTGIGSIKDKKKIELVGERLARITGQKPAQKSSKKSIASFKVRQGDIVAYQVSLRGPKMYNFLDKLINIALPRTKDFRGIPTKSIDAMGNMTIGIKEHTIFPETSDEDLKDVFGMAITVVTSSRNPKDTLSFLKFIGFPMGKIVDGDK